VPRCYAASLTSINQNVSCCHVGSCGCLITPVIVVGIKCEVDAPKATSQPNLKPDENWITPIIQHNAPDD
jgi:hypothetical protein